MFFSCVQKSKTINGVYVNKRHFSSTSNKGFNFRPKKILNNIEWKIICICTAIVLGLKIPILIYLGIFDLTLFKPFIAGISGIILCISTKSLQAKQTDTKEILCAFFYSFYTCIFLYIVN